jgi:hypothetical protein
VSDLPAGMTGQPSVTIEAYLRYDGATSQGFLFKATELYCAIDTTGVKAGELHCCWDGGQYCVRSNALFTLGPWHHVAVVFHASRTTLYLDGVFRESATAPYATFPQVNTGNFPDASARLAFGSPGGSTASSRSSVDEVRISFAARYTTTSFTPEKHLEADADSRLTLLLDEGGGTKSGTASLLGGASWVDVER